MMKIGFFFCIKKRWTWKKRKCWKISRDKFYKIIKIIIIFGMVNYYVVCTMYHEHGRPLLQIKSFHIFLVFPSPPINKIVKVFNEMKREIKSFGIHSLTELIKRTTNCMLFLCPLLLLQNISLVLLAVYHHAHVICTTDLIWWNFS